MNKHAKRLIDSILEEYENSDKDDAEFEAKSLFRLLNCCLDGEPSLPKKADEPNSC
jgi:hypothetical protein